MHGAQASGINTPTPTQTPNRPTTPSTISTASTVSTVNLDDRDTFLSSAEVMARYKFKRTKGYEKLVAPGFPPAIAGRWRLDLLRAWEDAEIAAAMAAPEPAVVEAAEAEGPGDLPRAVLPPARARRTPA